MSDLDADGYPTEAFLAKVKTWPIKDYLDCKLLLEELQVNWYFPDYFRVKEKYGQNRTLYHVSTAGWSGNESLIDALQENMVFWLFCFLNHHRGGHYVFSVPSSSEPKKVVVLTVKEKLERLRRSK